MILNAKYFILSCILVILVSSIGGLFYLSEVYSSNGDYISDDVSALSYGVREGHYYVGNLTLGKVGEDNG